MFNHNNYHNEFYNLSHKICARNSHSTQITYIYIENNTVCQKLWTLSMTINVVSSKKSIAPITKAFLSFLWYTWHPSMLLIVCTREINIRVRRPMTHTSQKTSAAWKYLKLSILLFICKVMCTTYFSWDNKASYNTYKINRGHFCIISSINIIYNTVSVKTKNKKLKKKKQELFILLLTDLFEKLERYLHCWCNHMTSDPWCTWS